MNLVLLTHPEFLGSQSHSRFAQQLLQAYRARGHRVELRQPRAVWRGRFPRGGLAKWAGYADQYLIFPRELRARAELDPPDTLYVFCDQALGPWVPLLAHRPHVVHCHDLLALRSALGLVPENPTSFTGRLYQRYIQSGFRQARHFISISNQTRDELHCYGKVNPAISAVVHNGLNHPYQPLAFSLASARLSAAGLTVPAAGFLLHVGGGQWYKNTAGLLALYHQHASRRHRAGQAIPALWMVSPPVHPALQARIAALPVGAEVRFMPGVTAPVLEALYAAAQALLFPSLAEGFGWPIAEALACACPVLTTGEAPMTEVGGPHAHYLPRGVTGAGLSAWAEQAAATLEQVLDRAPAARQEAAAAGVRWAARYAADAAIEGYLQVYRQVSAAAPPGAPFASTAGIAG
jgi:glycosyltransferase involved in cell wall biosynthesis